MVVELNFGITCGVGVVLFRRHFQNFIALAVTRIPILRMSCLFLISDYFGIFDSVERPKIGRWNNLIFFGILYTLWPLLVKGKTNFARSWQSIRALRLVSSICPSSQPLTTSSHGPVWRSNIRPRVAFFSWTAALGKILTLDRLWNKGVPVMDWCYMCKRSGESVNHLLLHCPIAFELWSMVWSLFGVISIMPQGVADLFASWQGPCSRQHNIDLWRAVPHCVLWCLWRERNSRCFKGMEQTIHEIKSLFHSLFAWCSVFNSFSCSNFFVMLDHCNFHSWCNPFHVHSQCTWSFWFMKYRYLSPKKKMFLFFLYVSKTKFH